jgi:ATP-dependent Clp protease adaptor protein ClpS
MNQFNATHPMFEEDEVLVEELLDLDAYDLVVFNDEVNTFEHVIKILIKVCKHSMEQAEQCTVIIHYKGKCAVKKGGYEELKPYCEAILDAGIQAAIV